MAIGYKKDMVYEHLKREILDKLLYPGTRLPREVELARRLGVGQVTLRSALARLEALSADGKMGYYSLHGFWLQFQQITLNAMWSRKMDNDLLLTTRYQIAFSCIGP